MLEVGKTYAFKHSGANREDHVCTIVGIDPTTACKYIGQIKNKITGEDIRWGVDGRMRFNESGGYTWNHDFDLDLQAIVESKETSMGEKKELWQI